MVQRTQRPAFTLLEIMLVLLIIGALAAATAVSLSGASKRARQDATVTGMRTIRNVLIEYNNRTGDYPSTEQGLQVLVQEDYLENSALQDAWKNEYLYFSPTQGEQPYDLISAGPDGEPNTADDISIWEVIEQ